MKIYTKTGDDGSTGLFGGKRLSKDDIRIEAYGTVDELNAFVGLLADHLAPHARVFLRQVQIFLSNIGSYLATAPQHGSPVALPNEIDLTSLENEIDKLESALPPLKNFILPGGHPSISYAHMCRTICRRAERRVITLGKQAQVDAQVVVYLNRLSDYLFVLARSIGANLGIPEVLWRSGR